MEILHCSPEVVPFSKTGGLADVSSALPEALSQLKHRVTIVTPLYASVDRKKHGIKPLDRKVEVTLNGRTETFEVFEAALPAGTRVLLLGHDGFFGRPALYGTRDGDYPDNHLRFSFFSAAIFPLVRELGLKPDILHCHDWQTGLVSAYNRFHHAGRFGTVTTVHNLGYQGLFPAEVMPDVGLSWDLFNPDGIEFFGKVNFLKSGLIYADKVTTVSPRYAKEITEREFGAGLDGVLRQRGKDLVGILNGADYNEWSPQTDAFIPVKFDAKSLEGKKACKAALLKEFGLAPTEGPLFGVVGRLAAQKGFDLLAETLEEFVTFGASVVILGTGDRNIEEMMEAAARRFPKSVGLKIAYDNRIAHLIEAGSDFFVMPSRYEPCGLNQIYSMKYGTLPIVTAVGGLDDTVVDVDAQPRSGTGFKFSEFSREEFLRTVRRAIELFHDPAAHLTVVKRAMGKDFSWGASAQAYLALYQEIAAGRGN